MIYIKDEAVGIDIVINEVQKVVSEALQWSNYNGYHRAYKNETSNGIVAEVYKIGNQQFNGDYEEVFNDDRIDASSFFLTPDINTTGDDGRIFSPTISMIFQVNLSRLEGFDKRNDEEVHRKVVLAVNSSVNAKIESIETGISNVYSGLDSSQLKYDDMQPFHCFKANISVNFDYNCCTSCSQVNTQYGNDVVVF